MLDVGQIKEKLDLEEGEWRNRHYLPSSRSGYVIKEKYLNRASIIRDMGEWIVAKTSIEVCTPYRSPYFYKRYWDNLFDWECLDLLGERNEKFIKFSEEWNKGGAVKLLEKNKDKIIVNPQDLDGYDDLPPEDRLFIRMLFIYNKIPTKEELTRDLMLVDGIGEHRANKFIESGIFLYEDLLKNSNYNIFTFKINRNHLLEFKNLFDIAHKTIYGRENNINITVAGSMGRGKDKGHDIDLLFNIKNKKEVLEIMNELSYHIINKDKNYNLILKDTFVRVDISFYTDEDRVTQFFHYFGPVDMNILMRKKAINKGYSLNQYGLKDKKGIMYHPRTDVELLKMIGLEDDPREKYWT